MTKLRKRMEEQGYSTRSLAEKVPCHYTLISKVRSGKKTPGYHIAKRISEITGVPMEDLQAMDEMTHEPKAKETGAA